MKCPKCGYISFDDLSTCTKCSTDLSAVAAELKGTGTETEPGFFLGSAIKNTNLDFDDTFSTTQSLPPIENDVELDFNDTASGSGEITFSPDSMPATSPNDLDSTGDVALELGEIMPIDLSQLDATMEISALATQGKDEASESLPDEATMAVDLADLTSQNLEPVASDSMDLTGQLAELENDDGAVVDDAARETEEDALDDTIVLPELDRMDVELAEEEGEGEDISLDDTAALDLDGLEELEENEEPAAAGTDGDEEILSADDTDVTEPAAPDLNLEEIDLSDLVVEDAGVGEDEVAGVAAEEVDGATEDGAADDDTRLDDVDLDATAETLDLAGLEEVEEDAGDDAEQIEDIELPEPENDEIPLPDLGDTLEEEETAAEAVAGDAGGGPLDTGLPTLDNAEEEEEGAIVDLSSLIEEEGIQDEGDATIELDMLSDEPVPEIDPEATGEIPELEVDMTPIDEDDDTPPDIPDR